MIKKQNKGFTLIELLVVVAIIGLLASIVMVSLNTARAKARDARRKGDLRALQTAIEMYGNDHGSFPIHSTAINSTSACGTWIAEITSTYMAKQPCDPNEATYHFYYISDNDGADYEINVTMEADTTAAANDGGNSATQLEVGTDLTLR